MPSRFYLFVHCGLTVAFLVTALAGCKRKEIRVYTAPKDQPFNPEPAATTEPKPPAGERQVWRPALTYTAPAGWQDLGADAANVARFSAGGAMVAVTALMSMQGNEAGLVNMWRQVRGQPPLSDADAAKTLQEVPIAGDRGFMFEVADEEEGKARRFIVAFVHRAEGSLFFKIQGDDAAVNAQKPAFFEFLKSVQFTNGSAPAPAPTQAATPEPPKESPTPPTPANLPAGWTAVAPGPMQVAKFTVPEK